MEPKAFEKLLRLLWGEGGGREYRFSDVVPKSAVEFWGLRVDSYRSLNRWEPPIVGVLHTCMQVRGADRWISCSI